MKTALTTALFIVNIEGTVHMGNIFKDILDGLSTPAKEPVKQKATGLGAKSSFGQAFAEARDEQGSGGEFEYKGKSYTTNFAEENTVAKLYKAVVLEQNKDDNGNTPTGSTTSIAYNSTSDDDSDVISQGYYPDKIIRDSLRSGKLGSSSPRRNMTTEALDDIENAIEKSRREAVKNAERSRNSRTNFNVVTGDFFLDQDTGITADPMISGTPSDREDRRMYGGPPSDPVELRGGPPAKSFFREEGDSYDTYGYPPRSDRGVDALEGPEASGPIVKRTPSAIDILRKLLSRRTEGGPDPLTIANPKRGLMGKLGEEGEISRSVIDLEGGEAGDYSALPLDAKEVQRLLGVTVDGKFGKNSKLALKAFQRRAGLPVTGEYRSVATQAALQQSDSSDPRNTAGFFDIVDNLPKNLLARKGSEYRKSKIKLGLSYYADPLISGGVRGNSRVYGDASQEVQETVINKIILEGKRAGMTDDQIAMTLAIANVESGFNPDAAAGTTSAAGLGQFIDKTGAGYSIDNKNRWDLDTQVTALIDHTLDNYNLVARRGETDKYVYKYHHDGPSADHGGLKLSSQKVMPLVKRYKKLLEG